MDTGPGLRPGRRRGVLRAVGRTVGSAAPLPLSAWRQLRRGGCEGTNPPRGRCGQLRLTAGACGGAERSPLPGARHNPQKVVARRKSRILPEPRPPGWRAVAKGHQKERGSGGAAHLCRFLAASAAEKRPGSRRRNPPGSRPAPRRAPASPELSAETRRNCKRSESWGAAPPSLPQHHVMPPERGGDPRQPPRTLPRRARFGDRASSAREQTPPRLPPHAARSPARTANSAPDSLGAAASSRDPVPAGAARSPLRLRAPTASCEARTSAPCGGSSRSPPFPRPPGAHNRLPERGAGGVTGRAPQRGVSRLPPASAKPTFPGGAGWMGVPALTGAARTPRPPEREFKRK